jgi:hypothetical protein
MTRRSHGRKKALPKSRETHVRSCDVRARRLQKTRFFWRRAALSPLSWAKPPAGERRYGSPAPPLETPFPHGARPAPL